MHQNHRMKEFLRYQFLLHQALFNLSNFFERKSRDIGSKERRNMRTGIREIVIEILIYDA